MTKPSAKPPKLQDQECIACSPSTPKLNSEICQTLLHQLHSDWVLNTDINRIKRVFHFKNYHQTIAFVNALAWIAHQQNHHPELTVGYNYCQVNYSTHSINGLSENDFICAAKIDCLI